MKLISNRRIIDLSRIIAGPYATMVLADFGCEIIKIEPPEGDPTRQWGPPWHQNQSTYFMAINRNKKSLALNLKQQKCRQVLYKLVAGADAVIENFVPGVTQKLGIDYETLKRYNEELVYCSISGFGDIGTRQKQPAFDNLIQAETGYMHLTGPPEGDPFKLGFAIADVVTSLYAANALMAGLIYKMQNGKGIHLKTSLYECGVASLINMSSAYLNGGVNPERLGNYHPSIVPYGLYKTKTSSIVICVGTPQQYERLTAALNMEDFPEFRTNRLRVANRKQFDEMMNGVLAGYTAEQLIPMLEKNKIPFGRVNDLKGVFDGKTVRQLGLVEQIGSKRFVRSPIRSSQNNMQKLAVPPELNQDGRHILEELGLSQGEIVQIEQLSRK